MLATIRIDSLQIEVDLSQPHDISIPYRHDGLLRAWYLDPVRIEPVKSDGWIGAVSAGAPVNFNNIFLNPHAHGTHTESAGHITEQLIDVNAVITEYHMPALLISVQPQKRENDFVIDGSVLRKSFENAMRNLPPEITWKAIVIRTLPNAPDKVSRNYSHSNPPYFTADGIDFIIENNINHLLTDLPSIDREEDGGALAAHKKFWDFPDAISEHKSITEFTFIPDHLKDGAFFLNLQTAPVVNDATPSRPVLYAIQKITSIE